MELSAGNFNPSNFYENYADMMEMFEKNPKDLDESNVWPLISAHLHKAVTNPMLVKAPRRPDFEWLNSGPIDIEAELQNKVYVVDFFTYCCINCIHILPFLKAVEEEMKNESSFAVIGVHSPKFPNEMATSRLREAVYKYDITHPVLNDKHFALWKAFGITCWPTVLIIGPSHRLLFVLIGENQINKVLLLSRMIMKYFKLSRDIVDSKSNVPSTPIVKPPHTGDIFFPGNISSNSELLLVSDTKHSRLIVMTRDLLIKQEIIGSSLSGDQDGSFADASFNNPQGTCWYGTSAYVADTGNHSVRKIDFVSRQVSTVFSGKDNDEINALPNSNGFRSPWDVCIAPKIGSNLKRATELYIAVSGSHQIWSMGLESTELICTPFAGSGKEENRRNTYRFKASFAQPTGIAYSACSPRFLYVVDSESSSIRSISLIDGSVNTICGGSMDPCDLFAFGDRDGIGFDVKFQHPMGLCVINESLLAVADTYNHKIKLIDTVKRSSRTEGDIHLCEPGGICIIDNVLYIADTNNHCIKTICINPDIISKLIFQKQVDVVSQNSAIEVEIKYGACIYCYFKTSITSDECKLTNLFVPWKISFKGEGYFDVQCNSTNIFENFSQAPVVLTAEPFSLVKSYDPTKICEVTIRLDITYCDSSIGLCMPRAVEHKVLFKFRNHGTRHVNLFLINHL